MAEIKKVINDRFANFINDYDYETYLLLGGYGSSKSYHIALKIILCCLHEKRKALVIREVYDSIGESCFDLIKEILLDMDLLTEDGSRKRTDNKVMYTASPYQFKFANGSRIIFKGMDKPSKTKSLNGVSMVWLEEASEIKYNGYLELLGRLRTYKQSMHYFLSTNPVDKNNWIYRHFFKKLDNDGKEEIILDDEELYKKKTMVKNGVYYHHSLPTDNIFLPESYKKRLQDLKKYDVDLWRVAWLGEFGANGEKVLPRFKVADDPDIFRREILKIPRRLHFTGMDFGFVTSFNAVLKMAVDDEHKILYIYDELYIKNITDDEMAESDGMKRFKDDIIVADNEDPKAIAYYNSEGYKMRGTVAKFAGSRKSNTKKMRRFTRIICSPKCKNTISELKNLTFKVNKNGVMYDDEFNIDSHCFSSMWYGLDLYNLQDIKYENNSIQGTEDVHI